MTRALLASLAIHAAAAGVLRSQPVTGLCSDPAPQEAGYYDIDGNSKHYFFYMAKSRSNPASDPVGA